MGAGFMERNNHDAGHSLQMVESDPYKPPDNFKQLESLVPLVEEAGSDNTELWLIQLPANELASKDLMDKQWGMQSGDSDGKLGHFYNSRGEMYDVLKQEVEGSETFAILPDSSAQYHVRKISCQVSFKRPTGISSELPAATAKPEVRASDSHAKEDFDQSPEKKLPGDEKEVSVVTEIFSRKHKEQGERDGKKNKKKLRKDIS